MIITDYFASIVPINKFETFRPNAKEPGTAGIKGVILKFLRIQEDRVYVGYQVSA